jgi:hypothetical protein
MATAANQETLVDLARSMTASLWNARCAASTTTTTADRDAHPTDAVENYRDRYFSTRWQDNGNLRSAAVPLTRQTAGQRCVYTWLTHGMPPVYYRMSST